MTRQEAKQMAHSRNCSCIAGKDRDNNYNECIDKIFDHFEQLNNPISSEQIKSECEKMYSQIKEAEDRLEKIRSICKHEKTFEGNYSWRVGSYQLAHICEYCGEFIKYK